MFERLRVRRAAREYASKLPRQLAKDYGPAEFYTEPQIRKSAGRANLNANFVVLGFAAYVREEEFKQLKPSMPFAMDYDAARRLFLSFLPSGISSGEGTPVDSLGASTDGGGHS